MSLAITVLERCLQAEHDIEELEASYQLAKDVATSVGQRLEDAGAAAIFALLGSITHLENTLSVVRDRAEGVHSEDETGGAQQAKTCQRDSIEA